jgi:hypothetical protein
MILTSWIDAKISEKYPTSILNDRLITTTETKFMNESIKDTWMDQKRRKDTPTELETE